MSDKSQVQKFSYQEIPRQQISAAPYNPRKISAYARSLLKKKIEEVGIVEPLVWNKRTGNLVSGHRRLEIMDEIEGSGEYRVAVAVIDVSLKTEKELNVFMNNTAAQGTWDEEAFAELVKDATISIEGMGFTRMDLELEFPDLELTTNNLVKSQEEASKLSEEEMQALRDAKKKGREVAAGSPEADADYFLVMVFHSEKDKEQFLRVNNMAAGATHISADEFAALMRPETLWRAPGRTALDDYISVSDDSEEDDEDEKADTA